MGISKLTAFVSLCLIFEGITDEWKSCETESTWDETHVQLLNCSAPNQPSYTLTPGGLLPGATWVENLIQFQASFDFNQSPQLSIFDCPENRTGSCDMVMITLSTASGVKDAYPGKINGTESFGWVRFRCGTAGYHLFPIELAAETSFHADTITVMKNSFARITEPKSMNFDNLMGVFGEIDATTDIFLLYSENVWSAIYPKLPYFKLSAADYNVIISGPTDGMGEPVTTNLDDEYIHNCNGTYKISRPPIVPTNSAKGSTDVISVKFSAVVTFGSIMLLTRILFAQI